MHRLTVIVFLAMCLFSCSKELPPQRKIQDEYMRKYNEALTADDPAIIQEGINFLERFETELKSEVDSLYYNKAQLLFRLRRYDEALRVLYEINRDVESFFVATLLLRLNKDAEGRALLKTQFAKAKNHLLSMDLRDTKRMSIATNMVLLMSLMQEDPALFYLELQSQLGFTQEEANAIMSVYQTDRDQLLRSMWPD